MATIRLFAVLLSLLSVLFLSWLYRNIVDQVPNHAPFRVKFVSYLLAKPMVNGILPASLLVRLQSASFMRSSSTPDFDFFVVPMSSPSSGREHVLEVHVYAPPGWIAQRVDGSVQLADDHSKSQFEILLFYHGGAYRSGHPNALKEYFESLMEESRRAGQSLVIVAPSYRLCPTNSFEDRILRDGMTAVHFVRETFGSDRRLVVSGESAGGHLSMAVVNQIRVGEYHIWPRENLLLVPFYAGYFGTPYPTVESHVLYGEKGLVAVHHPKFCSIPWRPRDCLDDDIDLPLPTTWILSAEYDFMRDESKVFADQVREKKHKWEGSSDGGGEMKLIYEVVEGQPHGFLYPMFNFQGLMGVQKFAREFLAKMARL